MKSKKIQHIVKIVLFFFSYSVLNVYRIIVVITTVGSFKHETKGNQTSFIDGLG